MLREDAFAKINLTLHVGGIIACSGNPYDGYHPVDSLVVFANFGDVITGVPQLSSLRATSPQSPAKLCKLRIEGPFSDGLDAGPDNLILKAYAAVANLYPVPPMDFILTKNLPVASGIGGGSANAAATLRLLATHLGRDFEEFHDIAASLGADVPVCLYSRTARMWGVGERVTRVPGLGGAHAVLVNPGVGVSTAAVFRAFDSQPRPGEPRPGELRPSDPRPAIFDGDLTARAQAGENDLQPVSLVIAPVIKDILEALSHQDGCDFARMSGSGATCFGLFKDQASAERAALALQSAHPEWWVVATRLGDNQ